MRIAVCDDEKKIIEEVTDYLQQLRHKAEGRLEIRAFQDAENLLYEIEERAPYDIIFLDIAIGKNNGISVAENIKKCYPTTLIIFMTGFHQYVYEVFDVQPCGFLRKPLKREEFEHVFDRALEQCDSRPALEYSSKGCFYRVFLKNIWFITSRKGRLQ